MSDRSKIVRRPAKKSEHKPTRPSKASPSNAPAESMRLSKYMSQLGLCSRREADAYIEKGWVKVNGQVVDQLGTKVTPPAKVELTQGATETQGDKKTVILYKPLGYVSGPAEEEYPSALDLIQWLAWTPLKNGPSDRPKSLKFKQGLAPVGRLDVNTTGLLIMSAKGPLVKKIIGPDTVIEKEYLVKIESPPTPDQLQKLRNGTLVMDGQTLKKAHVDYHADKKQLTIVLTQGKKRQVRRMCELVGLNIVALRRVRIGALTLKGLKPGQWRFVDDHEILDLIKDPKK